MCYVSSEPSSTWLYNSFSVYAAIGFVRHCGDPCLSESSIDARLCEFHLSWLIFKDREEIKYRIVT